MIACSSDENTSPELESKNQITTPSKVHEHKKEVPSRATPPSVNRRTKGNKAEATRARSGWSGFAAAASRLSASDARLLLKRMGVSASRKAGS